MVDLMDASYISGARVGVFLSAIFIEFRQKRRFGSGGNVSRPFARHFQRPARESRFS